jgi:hypothetical protein
VETVQVLVSHDATVIDSERKRSAAYQRTQSGNPAHQQSERVRTLLRFDLSLFLSRANDSSANCFAFAASGSETED